MALNTNLTMYVFNNEYVQSIPQLVQKDLGLNLFNLGLYVIGMVLYAIVIWFFYRNLAQRDIFKFDFESPNTGFWAFLDKIWDFLMYLFKSLIVFPFITSLWFLVLGGFLLFLSKSNDVAQTLLMSMTIIAAARVTAYFNEDLSKDVAKLVPFALLGVFIVDPAYFSLQNTIAKFYALPTFSHVIIQYLISIVFLEFLLRTGHRIYSAFKS